MSPSQLPRGLAAAQVASSPQRHRDHHRFLGLFHGIVRVPTMGAAEPDSTTLLTVPHCSRAMLMVPHYSRATLGQHSAHHIQVLMLAAYKVQESPRSSSHFEIDATTVSVFAAAGGQLPTARELRQTPMIGTQQHRDRHQGRSVMEAPR